MNLDNVTGIYLPAYYVCTGEESGECEATFDGYTYKLNIEYAAPGAVIKFIAGKFYALSGTVLFSQPSASTSVVEDDPVPDTPQELPLPTPEQQENPNPQPPAPPTSPYDDTPGLVFDTPINHCGGSIEYYAEVNDNVITASYRCVDSEIWIEIPVLSRAEVARTPDGLYVKRLDFEQIEDRVLLY